MKRQRLGEAGQGLGTAPVGTESHSQGENWKAQRPCVSQSCPGTTQGTQPQFLHRPTGRSSRSLELSALSRHGGIGFPFANLLGRSQCWSCSFPPEAPVFSCQPAATSPPKSCRSSIWMMQQSPSRASRAEASCKN